MIKNHFDRTKNWTSAAVAALGVSLALTGNAVPLLNDHLYLNLSPAPAPAVAGTTVNLQFSCAAGLVCQLQASSDLVNWTNVGVPLTSTGAPLAWSENISALLAAS